LTRPFRTRIRIRTRDLRLRHRQRHLQLQQPSNIQRLQNTLRSLPRLVRRLGLWRCLALVLLLLMLIRRRRSSSSLLLLLLLRDLLVGLRLDTWCGRRRELRGWMGMLL
jgi:hypothetical protein